MGSRLRGNDGFQDAGVKVVVSRAGGSETSLKTFVPAQAGIHAHWIHSTHSIQLRRIMSCNRPDAWNDLFDEIVG
jgi:hypothetical protein